MLCKYPINKRDTGQVHSCGQCLPCRINDRRIKTHRQMLEASSHIHNSFLTLTYRDEALPDEFHHKKTGQIYIPNSVNPDHHRLFINNLRTDFKRKTGNEMRFYACAEYGEKTHRPHYHYALFGFPTCHHLEARKKQKRFEPCGCSNCQYISRLWGKGHISLVDRDWETK